MDFIIDLEKLEHGQVSDHTVRKLIRYGLARLLAEKNTPDADTQRGLFLDFVRQLQQSPISLSTLEANTQHYEVPTAFFQLLLGKRLKYSAGYWPEGVSSLDDAEEAMLKLTCERAHIADGQSILDLGCGWGAFSLYVAEAYPHCHITGLSNSHSQKAFIDAQAARQGIRNLRIITADIAEFESIATFDRIVSIEMFEHLRNYEQLLTKLAPWLKPDGWLFVHMFTHLKHAYLMENNWLAAHFFTGGMMPSDALLLSFNQAFSVKTQWHINGVHYQKTSEAWLENLDTHKTPVLDIFSRVYGPEKALRMLVMWRVFLMTCAESFGYNAGKEWMVSHYLLARCSGSKT